MQVSGVMIADRDIVVPGIGTGGDAARLPVRDITSEAINYCFEDEALDEVAQRMAKLQVHLLPVLNRNKHERIKHGIDEATPANTYCRTPNLLRKQAERAGCDEPELDPIAAIRH
jgi:hypothetical protein